MKPSGIKLNLYSGLELAGVAILVLPVLLISLSAYRNIRLGTNYREALGHYTARDYLGTTKALDTCIEQRPEVYYPHELLAMCFHQLGDATRAEAKYREISEDSLLNQNERAALADLAVHCLKLEALRAKPAAGGGGSAYSESVEKVKGLANRSRFLEPKLVALQFALDRLAPRGAPERDTQLGQVLSEADRLEKGIKGEAGAPSTLGLALLYNTLGVVAFERGLIAWEKLGPADPAAPRPEKIKEPAGLTARACQDFRKAIQYKAYWVAPYTNLERALAFKLVEEGLGEADRRKFLKLALDYEEERDEYLQYLSTQGLKVEKTMPMDTDTLYTFLNSIGAAYADLADWQKAHDYYEKAQKTKPMEPEAGINRARMSARYWKQYEGLINTHREQRNQSFLQTREWYGNTIRHAGTGDAVRRLRHLNNHGVFLLMSGAEIYASITKLEEAFDLATQLLQSKDSMKVAAEKLLEKSRANGLRACDILLPREGLDPEMRKRVLAIKAKLSK